MTRAVAVGEGRSAMRGMERDCSRFVVRALRGLGREGGVALDIPSGEGRHSRLLARFGMQVVSGDIDINSLEVGARRAARGLNNPVWSVRVDAMGGLPFKDEAFDLVLVVHFHLPDLIPSVVRLIKPYGLLIMETYGANGGNWRTLPTVGQMLRLLVPNFSLIHYKESRLCKQPDRVTLKAIARKQAFNFVSESGDLVYWPLPLLL